MVERFVRDITGINVGKIYINEFWRNFDDQLRGGYIAPVDLKRKRADNAFLYSLYFRFSVKKMSNIMYYQKICTIRTRKGFYLDVSLSSTGCSSRRLGRMVILMVQAKTEMGIG
jgi:hypothetical protein